MWLLLGSISAVVFIGMLYLVERLDKETRLDMSLKESFVYGLVITLTAILIDISFSSYLLKILAMLFLTVLLFCALTDSKTKFVYRFFNLISIGIAFVFYITRIVVYKISIIEIFMMSGAVLIYMVILLALHRFKAYGMGDVLALSANAMFLPAFVPKGYFTIEILLWHYIIATLLLIICNIKSFDFKKMRLKERIAFVPEIYISTMILIIVSPNTL